MEYTIIAEIGAFALLIAWLIDAGVTRRDDSRLAEHKAQREQAFEAQASAMKPLNNLMRDMRDAALTSQAPENLEL